MRVEPLADKIIIEKIDPNEKTDGGIFIPHDMRESTKRAIVVAVGPGRLLDNGTRTQMNVEAGDQILYDSFASAVKIDGKDYMIMGQGDVLGIVRED